MQTATSQARNPAQPYNPLDPLAQAIGLRLGGTVSAKGSAPTSMSSRVAKALHEVLESRTPESRSTRMLLIRHLVDIESQDAAIDIPKVPAVADDLISTAQAAQILGFSRPYVAMLIDQKKLKGATVSAGGHRRVSRATVMEWKEQHQTPGESLSLRTEGQRIGAYKGAEKDVVRRIKALASSQR